MYKSEFLSKVFELEGIDYRVYYHELQKPWDEYTYIPLYTEIAEKYDMPLNCLQLIPTEASIKALEEKHDYLSTTSYSGVFVFDLECDSSLVVFCDDGDLHTVYNLDTKTCKIIQLITKRKCAICKSHLHN